MALAFLPGAAPLVTGIQASAATTKAAIGDENYGKLRSGANWGYAAINGFSPMPAFILLLPIKIAIFVFVLLVFIFVFDTKWFTAAIIAYLVQAVVVMFMSNWIMDKLLKFGLGI